MWRTGFPFITVDQFGRLVSGPHTHRFPDFLTLSPAIERKFGFRGFRWALRLGVDNVTDRRNPTVVDNDENSPTFLRFFGSNHRTFNRRVGFLVRKYDLFSLSRIPHTGSNQPYPRNQHTRRHSHSVLLATNWI